MTLRKIKRVRTSEEGEGMANAEHIMVNSVDKCELAILIAEGKIRNNHMIHVHVIFTRILKVSLTGFVHFLIDFCHFLT